MATAEEIKKRLLSGSAFRQEAKPKRKSARQQVREAEERLMDDIIRHLREKKLELPSWFGLACMARAWLVGWL